VSVAEEGVLNTSLTVLDRVLLIFIFVELLATIGTVVREREVTAEPFILIGLIAVVKRVLTVTAEIERSLGTPQFNSLVLELGVLTALIVALTRALYFTRRLESAGSSGTLLGSGLGLWEQVGYSPKCPVVDAFSEVAPSSLPSLQ
jgi:uncharacterized membrane protein (DUF373 family)